MPGASFTVSTGADPIAQFRLAVREARPTGADLQFGGALLIATIRDRTFAGNDFEGNSFTPYSPGYRKKKSAALGHGRVDLFGADHHTHMLNALQTTVDGFAESFGVGIYANSELETRARAHNEGLTIRTRLGKGRGKPKKGGRVSFDMPRRRWLDVTESERNDVERAIGDRIDERLKRLI